MILLALIPAAALLVIVVLCLRTKQQYALACEDIAKKAEAERRRKLSQDDEYDKALVDQVVLGKKSLGELLSDYSAARLSILPDGRKADPANWTNDDLLNFLRRWQFALATRVRRKLLFRTMFSILAVIGLAGSAAAWRYSLLSDNRLGTTSPAAATTGSDPFAAFASSGE